MGQGAFTLCEGPAGHVEQKRWPPLMLETSRAPCLSHCCPHTSLWWRSCYSLGRCVRTALPLVNGPVTSPCYQNDIINPPIVPLHEQHGSGLIFMDDAAAGDWGTSNGVQRPEPQRPEGRRSRRVGRHASADGEQSVIEGLCRGEPSTVSAHCLR